MPDLDEILIGLGTELLPTSVQFAMVLMALVGSVVVAIALFDIYRMISDDTAVNQNGTTVGGSMIRIFLGGLMVTPSVTLWRAADALLQGGNVTQSDLLGYIGGDMGTNYCDRFASAIQLLFILIGLIAIYVAYRNADDQARGFDRNGYRTAVPYFFGGLACFFINDIIGIIGATLGISVGFPQLCEALG